MTNLSTRADGRRPERSLVSDCMVIASALGNSRIGTGSRRTPLARLRSSVLRAVLWLMEDPDSRLASFEPIKEDTTQRTTFAGATRQGWRPFRFQGTLVLLARIGAGAQPIEAEEGDRERKCPTQNLSWDFWRKNREISTKENEGGGPGRVTGDDLDVF